MYNNIVIIHKDYNENNTDIVKVENCQRAFKALTPSAFGIWLMLAEGKEGDEKILSATRVEEKIGIKKTAYWQAIRQLKEKNYLLDAQGDLIFCECPTEGKLLIKRE